MYIFIQYQIIKLLVLCAIGGTLSQAANEFSSERAGFIESEQDYERIGKQLEASDNNSQSIHSYFYSVTTGLKTKLKYLGCISLINKIRPFEAKVLNARIKIIPTELIGLDTIQPYKSSSSANYQHRVIYLNPHVHFSTIIFKYAVEIEAVFSLFKWKLNATTYIPDLLVQSNASIHFNTLFRMNHLKMYVTELNFIAPKLKLQVTTGRFYDRILNYIINLAQTFYSRSIIDSMATQFKQVVEIGILNVS